LEIFSVGIVLLELFIPDIVKFINFSLIKFFQFLFVFFMILDHLVELLFIEFLFKLFNADLQLIGFNIVSAFIAFEKFSCFGIKFSLDFLNSETADFGVVNQGLGPEDVH
jgi:hypothetical protein